jgi:hypothetical protein
VATEQEYETEGGAVVFPNLVNVRSGAPCVLATTCHQDYGSLVDGEIIDGLPLKVGDRILVKHQKDPTENGIYLVGEAGSFEKPELTRNRSRTNSDPELPTNRMTATGVAAGVISSAAGAISAPVQYIGSNFGASAWKKTQIRANDMADGSSAANRLVPVTGGVVNSGKIFACVSLKRADVVSHNKLVFIEYGYRSCETDEEVCEHLQQSSVQRQDWKGAKEGRQRNLMRARITFQTPLRIRDNLRLVDTPGLDGFDMKKHLKNYTQNNLYLLCHVTKMTAGSHGFSEVTIRTLGSINDTELRTPLPPIIFLTHWEEFMSEKRFANNIELLQTETRQFFKNLREKMTEAGFGTSDSGLAPFLACVNTKVFFPEKGQEPGAFTIATEHRRMAQLWLAMEVLRSRTTALVQEWKILQHSHGLLNHVVNIALQRDSDDNNDGAKVNLDDLAATMTDHKKKATCALRKFFCGESGKLPSTKQGYLEKYPGEDAPNIAIKKMFDWIKRGTKNVQAVYAKDWLKPSFETFVEKVANQVGL